MTTMRCDDVAHAITSWTRPSGSDPFLRPYQDFTLIHTDMRHISEWTIRCIAHAFHSLDNPFSSSHIPGIPTTLLTTGNALGKKYTAYTVPNATKNPVNFSNHV